MSIMRSILCLTPSSLAFVLGGAHFWRAGQYPFSVGCMLFALLVWRREAWIRQVTLVLLPLLAARWVWAAAQFVQIRMFMEQPWMRLACILLGVSLFTATAALLLEGKTGDAWYARGRKRALMRTAAFFGTIAILTPLLFVAPQVFLTERKEVGERNGGDDHPVKHFLPLHHHGREHLVKDCHQHECR